MKINAGIIIILCYDDYKMFRGAAGAEKMHFRVFFIRKILILEGGHINPKGGHSRLAKKREDIAKGSKGGHI